MLGEQRRCPTGNACELWTARNERHRKKFEMKNVEVKRASPGAPTSREKNQQGTQTKGIMKTGGIKADPLPGLLYSAKPNVQPAQNQSKAAEAKALQASKASLTHCQPTLASPSVQVQNQSSRKRPWPGRESRTDEIESRFIIAAASSTIAAVPAVAETGTTVALRAEPGHFDAYTASASRPSTATERARRTPGQSPASPNKAGW